MGTYDIPAWGWPVLGISVVVLLALDMFSHRGGRGQSRKSAIFWSVVWIASGLVFGGVIYATMGVDAGHDYILTYTIEKSLSVDNLFVFLIIFKTLRIPKEHQHHVLFWGVIGALGFRALFIFLGVAALEKFDWVVFIFGAILFLAAYRAFRDDPNEEQESRLIDWLKERLPVTESLHGAHFFHRENGKFFITPLLLALIAAELTDIVFAVDSVPAALSVTRDRFIVYSSNAFAILGLRSLYVVLATTIAELKYLHFGLSSVLAFAGVKIVLSGIEVGGHPIHIPPLVSFTWIIVSIGGSVIASYVIGSDPKEKSDPFTGSAESEDTSA
jgi:tellurite resistance protein TerC